MKKVIWINLAVIIVLISLVESVPSIKLLIDKLTEKPLTFEPEYYEYLKEERKRQYDYHAFIGWKHHDMHSESFNVTEGVRKTVQPVTGKLPSKAFFFGGSTMWGSFVADKHTIPSFFAQNTNKYRVLNYGEQSYNSGQELNLLIQRWEEIKPKDVVVFYDGVNDVFNGCTRGPLSHSRVPYINDLINQKQHGALYEIGYTIKSTFYNMVQNSFSYNVTKRLGRLLHISDAGENRDKNQPSMQCKDADEVVENLIRNWSAASALVRKKGGQFICILQPNPHTSSVRTSQSLEHPQWKLWTDDLYPMIRQRAKNLQCFVDLSDVLKFDPYLDDCCHINAEGNKAIASAINSTIIKKSSEQSSHLKK